jgi:hypothetical protein
VGRLVSSLFPTERLQEQSVDVTVQAQGKTTFAELVERFAVGDSVRGVPAQPRASTAWQSRIRRARFGR